MAVADRYLGNNWYGKWEANGGTFTLSGDQTTFTVERTADMVEMSAGSDASKSYLASLKDSKFGYTRYDTGANGSTIAFALKEGTSGTLTFGSTGHSNGQTQICHFGDREQSQSGISL
jgi:hypothetical protein